MRFLFVVLLIVLATHVSAQETQEVAAKGSTIDNQTQGNADANEHDTWKSALAVKIVESPDQANHAAERETKSDKHDAEDLNAQARSADAAERGATAAERQVIPTYAQAVFGLIGMGLLTYTLILNAKATNAAIEANRIAGEHFSIESRPWIKIGLRVNENGIWVNADGFGVEYTPEIENVGNTPAFDVKWDNMLLVPVHPSKAMDVVHGLRNKIKAQLVMEGQPARGVCVWPHSRAPFDRGGVGRGDAETAECVAGALRPHHARQLTCVILIGVVYKFGKTECFTAVGFNIEFDVPEDAAGRHVSDVVRISAPRFVQEDSRFAVAD